MPDFRLPWRQRLHYFELGYIYLVSAIFLPGFYVLNFYSLFTNIPILDVGLAFVFFKLLSFYFVLKMYNELGQGTASSRMWAALFPVYLKAAAQALLYFKPRYQVTDKSARASSTFKSQWYLALPQVAVILLGGVAVYYNLVNFGLTPAFMVNAFWFFVMVYWLTAVLPWVFRRRSRSRARVLKSLPRRLSKARAESI